MLNDTEWQQIKVALEAMHGMNINNNIYVDLHNVKCIVERWTEEFYEQDKKQESLGDRVSSGTTKEATERKSSTKKENKTT